MDNTQFILIPKNELDNLKEDLKFITTEIIAIKQKNSKEFLNFKEAMNKLRVSRNTFQNHIDSGKITGINTSTGIYKKLLFRNADIEYFLKNEKRN